MNKTFHTSIRRQGVIFGFPTESFYAIGANATDAQAINNIFKLKQREAGKPIALIAADLKQVQKFFYLTPMELSVAKQHWPGSLTLLLKPKKSIASKALGATRIGVRVPAHAGARRLAKRVGAPITATSANISGQPATKSVATIKRDFPGILIVPGRCGRQTRPSTVIEIVKNKINIIRQGSVHV